MSSKPPRRRRPRIEEDERGGLPMVPIFAGVIVAGLGIGALLSALASRRPPPPVATTSVVVTHTPTPIAERTVAPTLAPAPKVTSSPKPAPSASATDTNKPTPKPVPTASPTTAPSATPKPRTTLVVATAVAIRTPVAPTLRPISPPPPPPRVPPTAAPTTRVAAASPAPVTPPPDSVTSGAESLVRRYIDAVKNGDDTGAYSALGGPSGNRLYEQQYLDPTARITSMSSTRTPAGAAKVQVEMTSPKGQYFLTFTVDGTRITDHAIIPVGGTPSR